MGAGRRERAEGRRAAAHRRSPNLSSGICAGHEKESRRRSPIGRAASQYAAIAASTGSQHSQSEPGSGAPDASFVFASIDSRQVVSADCTPSVWTWWAWVGASVPVSEEPGTAAAAAAWRPRARRQARIWRQREAA